MCIRDRINPNSMRKNLYEQGFDTSRSDFYQYKAFLNTLFPLDYSIIPDTTRLDTLAQKLLLVLNDNPTEIFFGTKYDFYKFSFTKKGRLVALTRDIRDTDSEFNFKWDGRGNLVYSDYYSGPSGGNGRLEREYDDSNNLIKEKYSHLAFWSNLYIREFDDQQNVTIEIIENDSLRYSKSFDYDENGNTKRIDALFMAGDKDAKPDTLFTKTTFFDLSMTKMNPDSGFGIDSVKTTGDESVLEEYKRFIEYWPVW
mgnify:CR=1 FL=1